MLFNIFFFFGIHVFSGALDEDEYLKIMHEDTMTVINGSLPELYQNEVCFGFIGCFRSDGPLRHIRRLPDRPEEVGTKFELYTRYRHGILDIFQDRVYKSQSLIRHGKPVHLITHGWGGSGTLGWINEMRDEMLKHSDVNVIIIDWYKGAKLFRYLRACANTELVGRQTALLIQELIQNYNISPSDVHFIGFSLGAHVAGFCAGYLREVFSIKIGRISVLDAAWPLFEEYGVFPNRNDADYMDVIHTSAGHNILLGQVGFTLPFGHVDFYPNGGSSQPGCGLLSLSLSCSHYRSREFFTESVNSGQSCAFRSRSCPRGFEHANEGECAACGHNGCGAMGYHSDRFSARGVQFVKTTDRKPFCLS